jgi:alkyldihydroxyacetonephosphate synthase
MAAMKWWGWGLEGVEFTHADKPDLAPFIERALGLNVRRAAGAPPRLADLPVPASTLPEPLRAALV